MAENSEQRSMVEAFKSGMGRAFRKVVPKPESPPSNKPAPPHVGSGAAGRASEASRSATSRRMREAGVD